MKLFQKDELKNLWPFYLEYFLASSLFFMPAFIVVYFSNLGLSAFQMGILLAVWPLSSLLFEIPTGAFADLYGRKASVLLGYFLEALVMLSLFFWKDFKLMLLSFVALGLATTFSSGSKDAWIVDMINKKNKKMIHGFFNKMQFFINIGLIFSGILGAFLVKYYGISIIWIAAFSSYILSIILLYLFTKEDYLRKKTKILESLSKLKNQIKQAISYSYQHHVLFYLIFAGMVAALSLNLQGNIAWIPLLVSLGMKEYHFGYLWSAMALVMAISPILAVKFLRKEKERNFIIIGLILWAIVNIGILLAYNLNIALIVLFLGLLFYFAKSPSEEVYFHRFIPSKMRATVGSIKNMMLSIAVIIILPVEGWLVDNVGAKYTILSSVLLMIPAIILYSKIREKEK
ncbi:MFS transporter [Candidatus Woesearchaeota archaeon]|nr:MFS transporter [Candidatus Woesearchaeota archaeon]